MKGIHIPTEGNKGFAIANQFCENLKYKQVKKTIWEFYFAWIRHSAVKSKSGEPAYYLMLTEALEDFLKRLYSVKSDKEKFQLQASHFMREFKSKKLRHALWQFYFAWVHSDSTTGEANDFSQKLKLLQQLDNLLRNLEQEVRRVELNS